MFLNVNIENIIKEVWFFRHFRLVYVSTLDGTISALDITNNGKLKWKIPTNPGTMLSSSIHQLEVCKE